MNQCPACKSEKYTSINYLKGMRCLECQTIYIPERKNFVYDDTYPITREHDQSHVEECKAQTTRNWLRVNNFNISEKSVFEFGFGQATSLEVFRSQGADVEGCEIVDQNRNSAINKGFSKNGIYKDLSEIQDKKYDYMFFFDSFEHIKNPEEELIKISNMTNSKTKAMVVIPTSDSRSLPILRNIWPHNIPDHWVFFSKQGISTLWEKHGWELESSFHPGKVVSLKTIIKHIGMFFPGFNFLAKFAPEIQFRFNIGEIGLVFKRKD